MQDGKKRHRTQNIDDMDFPTFCERVLTSLLEQYSSFFFKWSSTANELSGFSEFRESEKSLKHELGLNLRSSLLSVAVH